MHIEIIFSVVSDYITIVYLIGDKQRLDSATKYLLVVILYKYTVIEKFLNKTLILLICK